MGGKNRKKRDCKRDRGAEKTGKGFLRNKGRQKMLRKEKKKCGEEGVGI